jgi:hypothetical protein
MATQVSRHLSVRAGERELVDYLVEHVYAYRREAVVNHYVTLKSKRFVILAGPHDVDRMRLAQGVAEALVGKSTFQWSCFQAHPWWSTHTGYPSHFATAHARFNALKLSDLIEIASEDGKEGLPFFVGVKRMSLAEVECYFHDLPRGLLWRADASTVRVHLPDNLFVIGTLDVDENNSAWSQDVSRYTAVVHIGHDDLAFPERRRNIAWPKADWEQQFIRSRIRHGDQAKAKLARILPGNLKPLFPLDELRRQLGVIALPPFVLEEAWLYLANAFDDEGRGLFAESVAENLAIAHDYVLVQNVLPHIMAQRDAMPGAWDEVREYLAPRFPHAYAWVEHFSASDGSERGKAQDAANFASSEARSTWATSQQDPG